MPEGLKPKDQQRLTTELTKYAEEGASDEEMRQFRDAFVGELKKNVRPDPLGILPSSNGVTKPTQTTTSGTTPPHIDVTLPTEKSDAVGQVKPQVNLPDVLLPKPQATPAAFANIAKEKKVEQTQKLKDESKDGNVTEDEQNFYYHKAVFPKSQYVKAPGGKDVLEKKPASWGNLGQDLSSSLANEAVGITSGAVKIMGDLSKNLLDATGLDGSAPNIADKIVTSLNTANEWTKVNSEINSLPDNAPGRIVHGIGEAAPMIIGLALTGGESVGAKLAAQGVKTTAETIVEATATPLTKYLTVSKGLTEYAKPNSTFVSSLGAAKEGFLQGVSLTGQMGLAGRLTKDQIAGLAVENKFTQALIQANNVGKVFAASSAANNLLSGHDIDLEQAAEQYFTGIAFELPHLVNSVGATKADNVAESNHHKELDGKILQAIGTDNALFNFFQAEPEALQTAIDAKGTHQDYQMKSLENGVNAGNEESLASKQAEHVAQLTNQKISDIKFVTESILENKDAMIKGIDESAFTDEQKANYKQRIEQVYAENQPQEVAKRRINNEIKDLQVKKAGIEAQQPTEPIDAIKQKLAVEEVDSEIKDREKALTDMLTPKTEKEDATHAKKVQKIVEKITATNDNKKWSDEEIQFAKNHKEEIEQALNIINKANNEIEAKKTEAQPEGDVANEGAETGATGVLDKGEKRRPFTDENLELSKDNDADFLSEMQLSNAQNGYAERDGVTIRIKTHTPDWSNFQEDVDKGAKKIVNITIGDFQNTDSRRDKTSLERFKKDNPDVQVIDIKIGKGETLKEAQQKLDESVNKLSGKETATPQEVKTPANEIPSNGDKTENGKKTNQTGKEVTPVNETPAGDNELSSAVEKLPTEPTVEEKIAELEIKKEATKTRSRKDVIQKEIDALKGEQSDPPKKERRLTRQMILDSNLSKEFKDSIGEDEIYYDEIPNKVTLSEANSLIDYLGDENAAKEVKNLGNGLKPAVRNVVAQLLIKRYEASGDYDAAIDLREDLVKSATEQGQGVQSFAMWPSLSPEGEIIKTQKMISKGREGKANKAKPTTDKIKKGIRDINKETANEVVEKVTGKIKKASEINPESKPRSSEYGSKNKIVTKDKYLEAKRALRGKLFAAAIPPELITIGAFHVEAGSRKFADFSKALIDDLGKKVKPYLKGLYQKVREDSEIKDLSTDEEIAAHEAEQSGEHWKDLLEKAIASKNKKESDKAIANLQKIGKDEGLWGKYRDMAAKRLKILTPEQIKGDILSNPPLQEFTDGLVKNMQAKIDEALPEIEKGKKEPRKAIEVIGDAYKNVEKYQDVWDKTKAEFEKKNKDNPEVLESLDAYFGDILETPFSKKLIDKSVKEGLKDMNVKIADVVVKHYTVYDHTKTSLTEKLIHEAGLSGDEAKQLSEEIGKSFDEIATAKKKDLLEKAFSTKERKKPETKSLEDDLIKLTNLGAFKDEELVKAYGDKMGWDKMTPEQAKKIEELATAVQESQDGFKKFKAVEDLLAYQANIPGVSKTDIAISIWYSNILSGQSTQLVNLVGNLANSTALYANMVAQNPKSAKFIATGFIDGLKRGLLEAQATWQTGYSPIRGKVEIPSTLERVTFWGGKLNPYNYSKYVRRLMVASDVILFEAQKEMRAYQLAWKEAAKADKIEPTMSMKDHALEIMNKSDGVLDAAKEQAETEYQTEIDKINDSSETDKSKLIKQAELDRNRRVYELVEKERSGNILDESASFAARGTYNYKPEGALGVLANVINQATEKIKPLKLIIPFTNIIANVANESINYSPVGFARLAREGSITGNRKTPMTEQDKVDLMTKAIIGTSLMASAYILSHNFGDEKDGKPLIQITGNGTGDYKKNYELQATGWQPYSIKVGNTWISYQYTPLMLGLGFVGQVRDYETYRNEKMSDEGFLTKVSAAAGYTAKSLFDMTFLSSLNNTLSALMDPRNENRVDDLMKQMRTTGKGFVVPSVYTQTARQLENWFSVPTKEVSGTYLGDLLKDVPVARNMYYDKINSLGEPVIPDTDKIVSLTKDNKIWQLIADKKAFISTPSIKQTTIYDGTTGKERFLTSEEYYKFVKNRGIIIKKGIEDNYNKLKKMSPENVQENLKVLKTKATKTVKENWNNLK